jgi:hypothetical protein
VYDRGDSGASGRGGGGWKEKCYIFFGIVSLDKTGIKNKALSSYLKLNIRIMESNNL